MAVQKGLGSIKRFGTRYGRTLKTKVAKIEAELKKDHKCPYCSHNKVSRVSYGIWQCSNCSSKFTARAYIVGSRVDFVEESEQLVAEAPVLRSKKHVEEED